VASGRLDEKTGAALVGAADKIIGGKFDGEFVVDVFQAGAGTSQNMNINEVMANRAAELLGGYRGGPGNVRGIRRKEFRGGHRPQPPHRLPQGGGTGP